MEKTKIPVILAERIDLKKAGPGDSFVDVTAEPVLKTAGEIAAYHEARRELIMQRTVTGAMIVGGVSLVGIVGTAGWWIVFEGLPLLWAGIAGGLVVAGKVVAIAAVGLVGVYLLAGMIAEMIAGMFNGTKELRDNATRTMNRPPKMTQTTTTTTTQTMEL